MNKQLTLRPQQCTPPLTSRTQSQRKNHSGVILFEDQLFDYTPRQSRLSLMSVLTITPYSQKKTRKFMQQDDFNYQNLRDNLLLKTSAQLKSEKPKSQQLKIKPPQNFNRFSNNKVQMEEVNLLKKNGYLNLKQWTKLNLFYDKEIETKKKILPQQKFEPLQQTEQQIQEMHIDDKWVYNPKRRSTASLKARPKTQEKNEATTKVIRRSFAKENKNKISQEEKTKFIEFYQEGIEKVMSFRETRGNDNYDELASTIGLNELQYQPATQNLQNNPILKRLLNDKRVKGIFEFTYLRNTNPIRSTQHNRNQKSSRWRKGKTNNQKRIINWSTGRRVIQNKMRMIIK